MQGGESGSPQACKKGPERWKCTHKSYNVSSNKPAARRKETMALYPEHQRHIMLRELFGMAAGNNTALVPAEHIEILAKNFQPLERSVRCVYLGIDPGGGGEGRMGVCGMVEALTKDGPQMMIVLLAEVALDVANAGFVQRDAVVRLINRMRDHLYLNVPIIAAIEAAPGLSASNIARDIREAGLPDVLVMCERSEYMEGVVKTEKVTFEYTQELRRIMTVGCLCYWDNMIVDTGMTPRKVQKRLHLMMSNLKMIPVNKNQVDGDIRYKITAKIGGTPDDMLVAVMQMLYWRRKFWETPKYLEWQKKIMQLNGQRFML